MNYDPKLHHRHSIRLQTYDYTQAGAYFVTLCTHNREHLFGKVINSEMVLNEYGRIVEAEWFRSAEIRQEIRLDVFVVMPNHIHGIVFIDQIVGAHGGAPENDVEGHGGTSGNILFRPHRSVGAFIAGYKSIVTTAIKRLQRTPGMRVWQRNYFDHIIRKEESLERIRNYITNNPANWGMDRNNLSKNVWM